MLVHRPIGRYASIAITYRTPRSTGHTPTCVTLVKMDDGNGSEESEDDYTSRLIAGALKEVHTKIERRKTTPRVGVHEHKVLVYAWLHFPSQPI